ncbi:hypothetical protein BKA93DRAFT_722097 [Sparassis latifolia]
MFFSTELLERRDSGFGLLWLAATLGAKSSFRKLPKRSVLTADISQLCDLIAEPTEPLALRLSSNLMIVKQEIFLTDVTTCFNSLKKAVQEFNSLSKGATELQMGQPSLRPDALTLVVDPGTAFAMDFGNIFAAFSDAEESDDEFDPTAKKKQKQKPREKPSSLVENGRPNLHMLDEHHDHLLSGSFDVSFNGNAFEGAVPSSSQFDGGFGFSDDLFALPEGIDLGGEIGDELARELGEGWGISQNQQGNESNVSPLHTVVVSLAPFSPIRTLEADAQANAVGQDEDQGKPARKRAKRVRLLLDARTELTDDELKAARANYMEGQDILRQELVQKKLEKESGRLLEEMIWGVPKGLQAPVLVDFWLENFRMQVEARSGALYLESSGQPPTKRRKIGEPTPENVENDANAIPMSGVQHGGDWGMDVGGDFMMGGGDGFGDFRDDAQEPGQARRISRPPSVLGSNFDFEVGRGQDIVSGSQRSALFPWDNAGASSSVVGGTFDFGREGSAKLSFGRGAKGSSVRDSPLHVGRVVDPPVDFGLEDVNMGGEGFEFAVPGEDEGQLESQQSDMNLLTLERNSFNFLEYAKMQLKTFAAPTSTLTFDDVVPKLTSTPHVAAAAFYHCLVLATKDLIGVSQEEAYGTFKITVK